MIAERLDTHTGYQAIQQVPGIGPMLAAVFVAEIGDVHRFTDPAHLCSWAGLTPATANPTPSCTADTSPNKAPKRSAGRRSRRCSATRPRPRSRPTNNASKPAAARTSPRVAAARKLLTLVYYGLRDGHIRALATARAA